MSAAAPEGADPGGPTPGGPGSGDTGSGLYTVEFTRSRRTIEVAAGETILAAARAQGLRLPFSCAEGLCGTCKSRLSSGTVDMVHQGGIRPREIDQGLILLCCSKPTSHLVIER